jgi:hypothetical protein
VISLDAMYIGDRWLVWQEQFGKEMMATMLGEVVAAMLVATLTYRLGLRRQR